MKPMFNNKWLTRKKFSVVLFVIANSLYNTNAYGEDAGDFYDLVLAGGALKTCGSFAPKNCIEGTIFDDAKSQNVYEISPEAHVRLQKTSVFNQLTDKNKVNINSLLRKGYADGGEQFLSRNEFLKRIDILAGDSSYSKNLADDVFFALLDTHERLQEDGNHQRLKEQVNIARTTSAASREIYQAFIKQAHLRSAGETPHIVVVTASSRDPFSVADFYTNIFEELGAKVTWLPISGTLQLALWLEQLNKSGCSNIATLRERFGSFDRERVYPDLASIEAEFCRQPSEIVQIINQADGIFFNGGDQSRTLSALLTPQQAPSDLLSLIRQRVKAGELVVGGTSAGTAVQGGGVWADKPIPMLTNGSSENAMARGVFAKEAPSQRCSGECVSGLQSSDVTIKGDGGTGLFSYGLLDTHFSERDRETRLVMATLFAQQSFGFGVDETTALLTRFKDGGADFKVVGAAGVFVVDLQRSQWQQVQEGKEFTRTIGGIAHYWPAGTQASINADGLTVKLPAIVQASHAGDQAKLDGVWRRQMSQNCGTQELLQWQDFDNKYQVKASNSTQFALSPNELCGYQSLPFVIHHSMID
ncbi:cyanophycinase [Alteromonas facilis]|uniref:cyanophycinase n=1 Tax=Alteromonas facilis TaxID=2048004 RepID=UPI000C28294E|nr:cyanophycinase [Alteromonas facilis]